MLYRMYMITRFVAKWPVVLLVCHSARYSDLSYDILTNHNIEGYFRYVDDILIVYNESKTNTKYFFN